MEAAAPTVFMGLATAPLHTFVVATQIQALLLNSQYFYTVNSDM